MLAIKDSFVGKDGFPNCGEHASVFIFLGLEKGNYVNKVMILLKPLKIPGYKTSNKLETFHILVI